MSERGDLHVLAAAAATVVSGAVTGVVGATKGTDLNGIALIIVALGSFITAVGGVVVAIMVNRVHREVRTGNELRMGELEAARETRRVEEIPHDERTAQEQRHIDTAPEPGPPQGPSR